MTYFLIAVVVLLAILVAVAIPALLQLRTTLASAQKFLDTTGPQVERTLAEITTAARRVEHIAGELEQRVEQAKHLLGSLERFTGQVGRIGSSIHTVASVGAAVGPALVAALRSFFKRDSSHDGDPEAQSTPIGDDPVFRERRS